MNSKKCAFGQFIESAPVMSGLVLFVNITMTVTMAAVLLATVWSFVDYLIRFKDDLKEDEDVKSLDAKTEEE